MSYSEYNDKDEYIGEWRGSPKPPWFAIIIVVCVYALFIGIIIRYLIK